MIYGEGRGAAVCDFDQDGRIDLVVGQNGTQTRLFHNVRAKPGLRVRVAGVPGNPDGIGTQLRLLFGNTAGPVREVQAGGGYWSQDSTVQVFGRPQEPTALWVRWPGGITNSFPIPAAARELVVSKDGVAIKNRPGR
jgi:enediyne biosynthesis protein E4